MVVRKQSFFNCIHTRPKFVCASAQRVGYVSAHVKIYPTKLKGAALSHCTEELWPRSRHNAPARDCWHIKERITRYAISHTGLRVDVKLASRDLGVGEVCLESQAQTQLMNDTHDDDSGLYLVPSFVAVYGRERQK